MLFRSSSVQSCCREGGALQTESAVCGEHSPCSGHTGFAPHRGVCAFLICTAQAPGCSIWSGPCVECSSSFRVFHKIVDLVAPAFCAFPGLSGSGSPEAWAPSPQMRHTFSLRGEWLRHPEAWVHSPGCGAPFPSVAPAHAAGCRCLRRLAFVQRSWPLAATFPAVDVNHPESQEFFRYYSFILLLLPFCIVSSLRQL